MSTLRRWLGIDFSGDAAKWNVRCSRSNVWVATIVEDGSSLRLAQLSPIQALPGIAIPFQRLAERLALGDFEAVGIDAPFSLPSSVVGTQNHDALLTKVSSLPRDRSRPFGRGLDLARGFVPGLPQGRKIYRHTEDRWRERGLNVRSTIWAGPRGGAAMTVACMTLLRAAGAPLWPWNRGERGLVAEAYPAAQLRHWGLPHQQYAKADDISIANRRAIIGKMGKRLAVSSQQRQLMTGSADAIDAVLCAFAGVGVSSERLESEPGERSEVEGWIAVHG